MTYIPDFRQDENKLTELDRQYWLGYKNAMEDAENNLKNAIDNLDMTEDADLIEEFEILCDCSEVECMCSIVENNEEYENIEFVDSNEPLYKNTIGAMNDNC